MIRRAALLKPVPAVVVAGLLVAVLSQGEHATPSAASIVRPRIGLDGTSDAEARQMRHVTRHLSDEIAVAARCRVRGPARQFEECVAPALRHAGVGGRGAALLLGNLSATVPAGRCLRYVLGLQAANSAAADNARWLNANLYRYRPRARRHALTVQLGLLRSMLRRSARAGTVDVCSPASGQPAA
jgi:hypothetical protein